MSVALRKPPLRWLSKTYLSVAKGNANTVTGRHMVQILYTSERQDVRHEDTNVPNVEEEDIMTWRAVNVLIVANWVMITT